MSHVNLKTVTELKATATAPQTMKTTKNSTNYSDTEWLCEKPRK